MVGLSSMTRTRAPAMQLLRARHRTWAATAAARRCRESWPPTAPSAGPGLRRWPPRCENWWGPEPRGRLGLASHAPRARTSTLAMASPAQSLDRYPKRFGKYHLLGPLA